LLLLQVPSVVGFCFVASRSRSYLQARFGKVEQKKWGASARLRVGTPILGSLLILFLVCAYSLLVQLTKLAHQGTALPAEMMVHGFSFPFVRLGYLCYAAYFLLRWTVMEQRLGETYNLVLFVLYLGIATRGAFPALNPPEWFL